MQALESSLSSAVAALAMAADRTRLTRVASIDHHDRDARELGLVPNEEPELIEGPAADLCSLRFPKPCALADPMEVFQGDAASGVFGEGDELLRDHMVLVAPETGLLAGQAPEQFLGAPGL